MTGTARQLLRVALAAATGGISGGAGALGNAALEVWTDRSDPARRPLDALLGEVESTVRRAATRTEYADREATVEAGLAAAGDLLSGHALTADEVADLGGVPERCASAVLRHLSDRLTDAERRVCAIAVEQVYGLLLTSASWLDELGPALHRANRRAIAELSRQFGQLDAALRSGGLTTPDPVDVRARAASVRRAEAGDRARPDAFRASDYVAQGLPAQFDRMAADDWYSVVGRHRRVALSAAAEAAVDGLAAFRARLEAVDLSRPSSEVIAALAALPLDGALAAVARTTAELMTDGRAGQGRDAPAAPAPGLSALQAALTGLREAARDPHLGVCLLLAGSFGSGRTRAVTELMATTDRAVVLLRALPIRRDGLEAAILAAARTVTDTSFATIDQFAAFVRLHLQAPCWLVIEEADRAVGTDELVEDLQRLIASMTRYRAFRWLITADEAALDVLVGRDPDFWPRYGSRNATLGAAGSGLVVLDDLDRRSGVGPRILGTSPGPAVLADDADPDAATDRLTWNPLPALVMKSVAHTPLHYFAPQLPAFTSAYWQRLEQHVRESGGSDPALIRRLAALIATRPQTVATAAVGKRDLDAIAADDDWLSGADPRSLVDELIRLRMLGWVTSPDDLSQPATLGLRGEEVWSHHVLAASPAGNDATTLALLRTWSAAGTAADRLAGAVSGAVLLGLCADPRKVKQFRRVWRAVPDIVPLRRLLRIGPSLPAFAQRDVAARLRDADVRGWSRADVFAGLRFAALAEHVAPARSGTPEGVARLELLQRLYQAEPIAQLAPYVVFCLEQIEPELDAPDIAPAMLALHGIERAGLAERAAHAFAELGHRLFPTPELWLSEFMSYIGLSSSHLPMFEGYRGTFSARGGGARREPGFWQRMVSEVAHRIVLLLGPVDAMRQFVDHGWFAGTAGDLPEVITSELNNAATVKIGRMLDGRRRGGGHYREAHDLLFALVRAVAVSELDPARQRTTALYLVKHSVRTSQTDELVVAADLHGTLTRLAEHAADLSEHDRRLLDRMLAANGLGPV